MRRVFVLLLALVAIITAQACNFANVQTIETNINNAINSIVDKNTFDNAQRTVEQNFNQAFGPCLGKIGNLVAQVVPRKVNVNAKGCFIPQRPLNATLDDPDWLNDPCCNQGLNKCCALGSRKALIPEPIFKNVTVPCNDPEKIKGLVRSYYRSLSQLTFAPPGDDYDELNNAIRCVSRIVQGGDPCKTNADCDSNNCNIWSGTCQPGFGEINWGRIAGCFVNTPAAKFFLFKKYALTDATPLSTLAQKLKTDLETFVCVNGDNGMVNVGVNTKTACDNLGTRCEDRGAGSATCNGNYCRVLSSCINGTGICSGVQPSQFAPIISPQNCTQLSACRFNLGGVDSYFAAPAQACAAFQVCAETDPCAPPGTNARPGNQTACESLQYCQGPTAGPRCGFCQRPTLTAATCTGTLAQGCAWDAALGVCGCKLMNKGECDAAGTANNYAWVPPKNQQQCLADKYCQQKDGQIRNYNAQECAACGGAMVSRNTWRGAQWISQGTPVLDTAWVPRQLIPTNRWIVRFDDVAARNLLNSAMQEIAASRFRNFLRNKFGLSLLVLKTIACSCGDTKGTNCFASGVKSSAGEVIAVFGNNATFTAPSITVNVRDNSVSATKGSLTSEIKVEKNVDAANNDIPQAGKRQAATTTATVKSGAGGSTVGSIISENGVSLGSQFDGPVQVCISADSNLAASASSSYTKPAFARSVNGELLMTSLTVTKSDDNVYCGDVTNTDTYYAALVTQGAAPVDPVPSKKGNDATATKAGFIVGTLVLLITFLLL